MATLKTLLSLVFSIIGFSACAQTPAVDYALTGASNTLSCSVPVLRQSSLTRGLGFLWYNIGGVNYEYINNLIGAYTAKTIYPGGYGNQTDFNTAGVSFETFKGVKTDNGAGTGGATIFMLAAPATTGGGNANVLLDFGNSGQLLEFLPNTDTTLAVATGHMAMLVDDLTTQHIVETNGTPIDGGMHMWVGTINGAESNWELFVDGIKQSLTRTSVGAYTSISQTKAGMGSYHDGTTPGGGSGVLGGEYERVIDHSEIRAISMSPLNTFFTCP